MRPMKTAHRKSRVEENRAGKSRVEVDRRVVLKLAADAEVDPRTAADFLRGERGNGLAWERLKRVWAAALPSESRSVK